MVRRVGFGDTEKPPKEKRIDKQEAPARQAGGGKRATRLIVGAFLLVWLTAWSAAIAFSIEEIFDQGLGAAEIGLFVWVAVASIFWLLAANMLWRVLTGQPLSNGKRNRTSHTRQRGHGLDRGDWDHGGND
jgi:hypothetical protein